MNENRPDYAAVRHSRPAQRWSPCGRAIRARGFATAILFLLLGQSAPLFAQFGPWSAAPQTPHPAVVRVVSPERDGASLGSGTLIDVSESHGLVLTNWHVVKDAAGNVIVSFPDGFQSPGYVLKMDRDWDLAAVAIWRPRVAPVPIAKDAPRPGEILTIAGYGAGNYRAISGPCTEYLSPGPNLPYEIVELHAAARHGDSGGPILNSRGELAGVLFGEGGGDTSGTYCGRVRMFLSSIGQGMAPAVALNSAPVAKPLLPQPSPRQPATDLVADALPFSPPRTTNYPPISLPIGTLSEAPNTNSQAYTTTLPPPPVPEPEATHQRNRDPFASIISPLPPSPPMQAGDAPASQATAGQPSVEPIGWEQIAGHTWGEQFKTILAEIGAILVLLQIVRKIVLGSAAATAALAIWPALRPAARRPLTIAAEPTCRSGRLVRMAAGERAEGSQIGHRRHALRIAHAKQVFRFKQVAHIDHGLPETSERCDVRRNRGGKRLLGSHHVGKCDHVRLRLMSLICSTIGLHLIGQHPFSVVVDHFQIVLIALVGISQPQSQIVACLMRAFRRLRHRGFGRHDIALVSIPKRQWPAERNADDRSKRRSGEVALHDYVRVEIGDAIHFRQS